MRKFIINRKRDVKRFACFVLVAVTFLALRQLAIRLIENYGESYLKSLNSHITDLNQPWNETISELYGFEWNDILISEVIVSKSHSRHDSSISLITESESEYNSISDLLSNLSCITYERTYELPFVTLNDIDY